MSDRVSLLAGDLSLFLSGENGRKAFKWTGAATGTRTMNEFYSAVQGAIDETAVMDDGVPMRADTPDIYRLINNYFIDDDTVEHLTGGSLFSADWKVGTTENVLTIGYAQTTEFSEHDIGRTILGATTGDSGSILDFNTTRGLVWIRPDDPAALGDEFDNGTESYSVQDDAFAHVWQVDDTPADNAFVDQTGNANSAANADWVLFTAAEAVGDYAAFGFGQEFSRLTFDYLNGTAGVGGVVAWEYWNGAAWTALSGVTDNTTSFTAAAADGLTVSWTAPSDWAERTLDTSASLFWVRARITTIYSTNPVLDQGFVSGQGAGAFASHGRHGAASVAGESAWVGIQTEILGAAAFPISPHVYVYGESPDAAAQSFDEQLVAATKGASDWWGNGDIDILLKVKEADSIFGERPAATATAQAFATFFARQSNQKYGQSIKNNLPTAGGNAAPAIPVDIDLDDTAGFRQMVLTDASGDFTLGEIIEDDTDPTIQGLVTSNSGTAPNITLQYVLVGDPLNDFTGATGGFTGQTSTETASAVAPTNVGPAALAITPTFGATTEDINNGNGAVDYSVRVDPASNPLADIYERLKYLTRRGGATTLQGELGEEYVGNTLQINHGASAPGAFVEGNRLTQTTTNAEGIIVAAHGADPSSGLTVKAVRGTFNATDTISDGTNSATPSAVRSITPVGAAPFGTFAGGTFFGAPGVALTTANLAAGEEQAYQLIDDNGATQSPPNTQSTAFSNLVAGDTFAFFRRTGAAINKAQFTQAAGNNQGDADVVVSASIPTDNPTSQSPGSPKIMLVSASGEDHQYRYASYTGSTFTLASASTGTDGGTGSNTTIVDGGATFQSDGVEPGDLVRKTASSYFSRVVSVDSETQLTVEDRGESWASAAYSVNSLVENYGSGQNAWVPMALGTATGTTATAQFIYTSDIDVKAVVRRSLPASNPILPFDQDTTIGSTGLTVPAIRNADDIVT